MTAPRTCLQAIALPTDFSAKLARNTQLILAEETGITRVGVRGLGTCALCSFSAARF